MSDSLNGRINWVSLLKRFGVRLTSHTLPASGNCPTCKQGRLVLSQDSLQNGVWCYCRGCGLNDDLIGLASKFFNLSPQRTVTELQEWGLLPRKLATDKLLKAREGDHRLWDGAVDLVKQGTRGGKLVTMPGAVNLVHRLHLPIASNLSGEHLSEGPGALAAFCEQQQIEDALRPRRDTSPREVKPRTIKVSPPEDTSLVLPFYDVPGRVCSTTFVSCPVRGEWRIKHHFIASGPKKQQTGGLAFHPYTGRGSNETRLLMTDSVETYLRMQMKHFCGAKNPLPLACYRGRGDVLTDQWQLMPMRDLVFWSPRLRPYTLWQAISLDAKITSVGPKIATPAEYIKDRSPSAIVKKCLDKAVSWPEALAAVIESKDLEDLAEWLARMGLTDDERGKVIDSCNWSLREKLKRALGQTVAHTTMPLQGGFMSQRSTGWYFSKLGQQEEKITNTPFRVIQAIKDGEQIDYHVEALLKGQSFEFTVDRQAFQRRPFEIVEDHAIEQGIGVPAYNPTWQKHAMQFALQNHDPKVTRKLSVSGVDREGGQIQLPFLSICTSTGRVARMAQGGQNLPGGCLSARGPDAELLRPLLQDPESVTPLSVLIAATSQILGRVHATDPFTVGWLGKSARRAGRDVMRAIGGNPIAASKVAGILKAAGEHHWPSYCEDVRPWSPHVNRLLLEKTETQLLNMPINAAQMLYGQMSGEVVTIVSAGYRGVPQTQLGELGQLAVRLLSHACRRDNRETLFSGDDVVQGTYRLLTASLDEMGIEYPYLGRSMTAIRRPKSPGLAVVRAAAELAASKQLSGPVATSTEPDAILQRRRTVLIPRQALQMSLYRNDSPPLPLEDIEPRLGSGDLPVGITSVAGRIYWSAPRDAFEREYRSIRRSQKPKLRIVSA